MSNRLPDFIIVGGQKCGTTTIHHILAQHPQIFIPDTEIFFFDLDDIEQHYDFPRKDWLSNKIYYYDNNKYYAQYLNWYLSFFQDAATTQLIGEDSTTYMASRVAPERIAKFKPDLKLIFILRNPIQRAWSHYWHLVRSHRTIYTFEDALRFSPENILTRGLYREQIERFLQYFPRTQMKFIVFEDFLANKNLVISDICNFLGVENTLSKEVLNTWSNPTKYPRYYLLQLLLNRFLRTFSYRHYGKRHLPSANGSFSPDITASKSKNGQRISYTRHIFKQIDSFFFEANSSKHFAIPDETRQYLEKFYSQRNQGLAELTDCPSSDFHKQ